LSFLNKPTNPALPLPTPDYSRQYLDAHNNVLRLFFNQIQNVFDKVLGRNGGQFIDCPNGLFFNTQDQAFTADDTAMPVEFDQTYLSNAVQLRGTSASEIEVLVSGVYNFQYTGQLLSSSANPKSVALWITRNGTDISYSTRITTIADNGHYVEITWNFNIDLAAGEYVELETSVSNDYAAIKFAAPPATTPYPTGASSVLTVNFIAPLPEPRPPLPP
jgi:hypothetical protein